MFYQGCTTSAISFARYLPHCQDRARLQTVSVHRVWKIKPHVSHALKNKANISWRPDCAKYFTCIISFSLKGTYLKQELGNQIL